MDQRRRPLYDPEGAGKKPVRRKKMGNFIKLKAKDGHGFGAYEAKPSGKPRGDLVVIREIFGVNPHIRWVADGYAADPEGQGYTRAEGRS
jgi:hypothetical protein